MTIVEGEIETLKTLRETLDRSGITGFNSVGEINRFLQDYESERKQLSSRVDAAFEAETQNIQATLGRLEEEYLEQKAKIKKQIEEEIEGVDREIRRVLEKRRESLLYRVFSFGKARTLSIRKSRLEANAGVALRRKTRAKEDKLVKLKQDLKYRSENKERMISERSQQSLDELIRTKEVVDSLQTVILGAIGESAVVNALKELPDDCYLINDFSVRFNPPIFYKKEKDRIFSIQIDHLLVTRAGIFLLETKNWSHASVESLDLRSPVDQIKRCSFALFVLLNSDSKHNDLRLEKHHWGAKKIPIKSLIVMTSAKPKEEFRHVKVISLKDLTGYVRYFDDVFSAEEAKSIFDSLKMRM